MTREAERLEQARARTAHWRRWGPYLADRQWGTVREDYSADGDAWDYFPHDHARSPRLPLGRGRPRSASPTDQQRLCFALALWNGRDPILKERLFGLTGPEGNHGEDVKEYYYYLDATPDPLVHEGALQVPAGGVPLRAACRREPAARHGASREFELIDTGRLRRRPLLRRRRRVRQGGARGHPDPDHVANRGPEAATLHLLPDALVPQHLVVGPRRASGPWLRRAADARARRRSPSTPRLGRLVLAAAATARPSCSSPRTRRTPSAVRRPTTPTPLRQGRHQRCRRPRARGAVNPSARDQGRRCTTA